MKRLIGPLVPTPVRNAVKTALERRLLRSLPVVDALDPNPLPRSAAISLPALFGDDIAGEWEAAREAISDVFEYVNKGGAVNPGDRRAIWYLIRRLEPKSVLEIGTHVGGSTIHIAMALKACGPSASLVTVDQYDVNDDAESQWIRHGVAMSPKDMLARLDCIDSVEFTSAMSLDYLSGRNEEFDFIFLDGSHSADVVYREIPLALKALRPGGHVLLHDYFPSLKPLWSNGKVIPGPCLAFERLRRERAELTAVPLGALPWATKLDSNVTSLALLARE